MQGLGFGSLVTFPHAATLYHSELLEQSGAISARAKLAMYCIAIASARPLPELLHGFCVAPLTVAEEFHHMATGIELLRHAHARNLDHDVIVSALRDELQIAQKQLDAIQTSTSWRLTRPLRLLIDVLRR